MASTVRGRAEALEVGSDGETQQEESRRREATARGTTLALRYAAPSSSLKGRFLRTLPVVFALALIACVTSVYVCLHIAALIGGGGDASGFARGVGELVVFSLLLLLQLVSFFLAVFINPGGVPDLEPEEVQRLVARPAEVKVSGERRDCKWCARFKPDRTHHCRLCRSCVLKMDHHCPWIGNCVGWRNHKFFMLSVLYAAVLCIFVGATMLESVSREVNAPTETFSVLFFLLFGETLDIFLAVVVTGFLGFHLYLMAKGMTTIEFCEKQFRQGPGGARTNVSIWNRGFWANFNDTFGYNPFLWFLPIDNRRGDGVNFVPNSSFLPPLLVEETRQGDNLKEL